MDQRPPRLDDIPSPRGIPYAGIVADESFLRAFGCSSARFFHRTLVSSIPNIVAHVDLTVDKGLSSQFSVAFFSR